MRKRSDVKQSATPKGGHKATGAAKPTDIGVGISHPSFVAESGLGTCPVCGGRTKGKIRFVTRHDFPLELHASIAARLFNGTNHREAAEQALILLAECKERLAANERDRGVSQDVETQLKQLGLARREAVPFKRAVYLITGHNAKEGRFTRARADYMRLLRELFPTQTPEELETRFRREMDQTMSAELVPFYRRRFQEMKSTAAKKAKNAS